MLTNLSTPVPVQDPFADRLLEICALLPPPFTLQEVVEAVELHSPDMLDLLPGAWEHLSATDQIVHAGLCGSKFHLIQS
ncbi:hypothetical protein DES53_11512 [Roseimicrobium gellanilyticum]|uniref:Uncharacterized protein n=1 Tax=Roseimicrobium gellanilyticum TaxID=748857 RepID=A0A366H5X4_9BACT|nr:hypothetical protein [Roseimicrobium gellanilyticum]RBP36871.1 hypothetical protein DES53_11512 [Roseimicrobium gellanilyticum]